MQEMSRSTKQTFFPSAWKDLEQGPVFVALGGAVSLVDDRENRATPLLGFRLCGRECSLDWRG